MPPANERLQPSGIASLNPEDAWLCEARHEDNPSGASEEESEVRRLQKEKGAQMTQWEDRQATIDYDDDSGGTTFHTHICDEDQHTWMCNSPYCASLKGLCPDHGGAEPVTIGREPW